MHRRIVRPRQSRRDRRRTRSDGTDARSSAAHWPMHRRFTLRSRVVDSATICRYRRLRTEGATSHARRRRRRHHRPAAHPGAGPGHRPRSAPVRGITTAPHGFEGEGFPVRRAFAGVALEDLDPFVHLDQMGEVEYAPGEPKGTPWHPHRGFETVTYMIDGVFEHSDSNGGGGVITNGDTQWMTAGAGILHIEKPPECLVASGGLFHGFQLWVNLPAAQKWARRATRTSARARCAALVAGRRRAGPGHRRRGRRTRRPGLDVHPDDPRPRHAEPGRPAVDPVARRLQRAGLRHGRPGDGRAGRPARSATGQLAVFGAGRRRSPSRAGTAPGERAARTWTCSSWAAGRSASRSPGWARS